MFKKKLVTITALAAALLIIPAVPARAAESSAATQTQAAVTEEKDEESKDTKENTAARTAAAEAGARKLAAKSKKAPVKKAATTSYKPVNAKSLTSSYKKKLAKQRNNHISVSAGNYNSRVKAEQNALIDITWQQLRKYSQVKISERSFDLMCRVVQCEAGNVKYSTKEMTAEVIVNRARSYKTSDPVYSALTAKNQFSVVRSGRINTIDINGETVNACKDALIKNSHPKNLKFFRAGYYFSWATPYTHADGTYFSLA